MESPTEEPDPEVAIHGVAHAHKHDSGDTTDTLRIGSVLPDQEVAIHDAEDIHQSGEKSEVTISAMSAHGTDVDPDDMLHGTGSEHQHLPLGVDDGSSSGSLPSPDTPNPDWMVTGHEHHTRLGVARDDEKDDFLAWKVETESKNADPSPADGSWLWRGFSLPFVSDSIEDDETVMKRRYLTRGEDASDEGEVENQDTEE